MIRDTRPSHLLPRCGVSFAFAALFAAHASVQAAPPRYAIVDLGTFGGELANAHAINESGHVVGGAERGLAYLPFVWRGEDLIEVGSLVSGGNGVAQAINDNGVIVGHTDVPYPNGPGLIGHAFLWSEVTGMIDLTPGHASPTGALAVNNAGQVAGYIDGSNGGAFVWSEGGGVSIIELPDMLFGSNLPEDINASGQVIGSAFHASGDVVAWVYDSATGQSRLLPPLEIAPTEPRAINEAGDVVGWGTRSNNQFRPLLWTREGDVVDLGFLPVPGFSTGYAMALNERRWIVGADVPDEPSDWTKAWLWIDGEKHELRDLIADPIAQADWVELTMPTGINERGEIVGVGVRKDLPGRAFLMRPLLEDALFADGFETPSR